MTTDFFFVYGTLKKGGHFAKYFDNYRLSSEKATLYDMTLYNLGWFPGILPGKGFVIGELHKYKDPDIVLAHMDRIEGYNDTEGDLFKRKCRTIITESGKKVKAIVYVYNDKPSQQITLIESGVWDLKKGE